MNLYYDFHIHSCLSPCGDKDMTPYNLVNMAKLMGLNIIALTDHNTCLNCPAAMEVGRKAGITVIPGMELCTSEEVHIICLFPDLDNAMGFSDYVFERIPKIKNRQDIFGEQLIMDFQDHVIGKQEILLTTAADIRIDAVAGTVNSFGGVCYPAHIDRSSYSVISNLGSITREMGFTAAEISAAADLNEFKRRYPILNDMIIVYNSDAHYLENMNEASFEIILEHNTASSLIHYFHQKLK